MKIFKVSIIVPCFNKIKYIPEIYRLLKEADIGRENEIIFIDDYSTDGTREYLKKINEQKIEGIKVLFHDRNYGKGASVRTALEEATGDYVIIQADDFNNNPSDICLLLKKAEEGDHLAVFGSQNIRENNNNFNSLVFYGARLMIILINFLYHQNLKNPNTCYKLVQRNLFRFINITENGTGFNMEITAKLSRVCPQIPDISVSSISGILFERKKIQIKDGLWAVFLLFKFYLFDLHFGLADIILRYFRIRAAKKFLKNTQNDVILDVGCGRQAILGWKIKKLVKKYIGVDAEITQSKIQNLELIKSQDRSLTALFPENYFDKIIALALIEHLDNPNEFVKNCHKILKNWGYFILTTPPPLSSPIIKFLGALHIIDKNEADSHKTYFNCRRLKNLLENNGFSVMHCRYFLFGFNTICVAKKI